MVYVPPQLGREVKCGLASMEARSVLELDLAEERARKALPAFVHTPPPADLMREARAAGLVRTEEELRATTLAVRRAMDSLDRAQREEPAGTGMQRSEPLPHVASPEERDRPYIQKRSPRDAVVGLPGYVVVPRETIERPDLRMHLILDLTCPGWRERDRGPISEAWAIALNELVKQERLAIRARMDAIEQAGAPRALPAPARRLDS